MSAAAGAGATLRAAWLLAALLLSGCSIQLGLGNSPPAAHDCVTGPRSPGCA